MRLTRNIRQAIGSLARLQRDRSGLALLEFAFSLPLVLGIGLYGVETANLALANLRVSQTALNLADNASRVGLQSSLAVQQFREVDVNDIFQQIRAQTSNWELTNRGRITLSSLEEKSGNQVIHWQRCIGMKNGTNWDSSYGKTTASAGSDQSAANSGTVVAGGMGPTGAKVTAPPASGVMFVEINYDYKPVVSSLWLPGGTARINYIASFVVRDRRDFAQIYNPQPSVASGSRMTCNRYTT